MPNRSMSKLFVLDMNTWNQSRSSRMKISPVCHLKYCFCFCFLLEFFFHFYFIDFVILRCVFELFILIFLLLAAVICLSLLYFEYSLSPWNFASIQSLIMTSPRLVSFCGTFVFALEFKGLCIVINFFVRWYISPSSSFVHLNNSLDCLRRRYYYYYYYFPLKECFKEAFVGGLSVESN